MAEIGLISVQKRLFGIQDSGEERDGEGQPCTAELAECTCPDFCERDHDND